MTTDTPTDLAPAPAELNRVQVQVNDAGASGLGLGAALATVDLKPESQLSKGEGSDSASNSTADLTFESGTTSTLESSKPRSSSIVSFISTATTSDSADSDSAFTQEEKDLLVYVTTLVGNCSFSQFFDKCIEGSATFIPLLEAEGGTDKDPATGHRRDSVPIASAIAQAQAQQQNDCESAVLRYLDESASLKAKESNAALLKFLLRSAKGVVVRVNPGTLSTGAQAALEAMLADLEHSGIQVMTSPQVVRQLGSKDSLVKIRDLRCGLPDTAAYYDAESFRQGFRKSVAFRPRVLKQNRGSQGEGIWICKLRDETKYCAAFGDRLADLNEELVLTEANDNHVEHHTVGEFLEFCVNGRSEASGEWTSTGTGRYLEGADDAMLVDQRFLPRIAEGEVRCNMVGPTLVSLVHKVPKAGGVSATLQSGAQYTSYEPDDPKWAALLQAFRQDLPRIMAAFGMEGQPLPLLWTADFILDYDSQGKDVFYVGEFNCSCVGITQELHLRYVVAETAVSITTTRSGERC